MSSTKNIMTILSKYSYALNILIFFIATNSFSSCKKNSPKAVNILSTPEEKMAPHTDSESLCWQIYSKAQDYIENDDWANGEKYCREALSVLKATDPQHAFGAMNNNMVRPLLENGKVEEALKFAIKALKINETTKDTVGIVISHFNLADVYTIKNNEQMRNAEWRYALKFAKKSLNQDLIEEAQDRVDSIESTK